MGSLFENHAPDLSCGPLIFEISFGGKANPLPPHGCRMAGWLGGGWVAGWLAGWLAGGGGGGGKVGNLVSTIVYYGIYTIVYLAS